MTPAEIEAAADALFAAERDRRQIGLLSLAHPTMTLDAAYAVQAALVRRKEVSGRRRIGWKIGLTSRAVQQALKIDTPDSGVLFDDMLFPDRGTVPPGRFIQPRVEAEIAFILSAGLAGEHVTRSEVLAATEAVAPALEILDTRILRADPASGRLRSVVDTVADNAANAGLVLGPQRHDPAAVDLRRVGAIVKCNGVVEETGLGAGVLDDPVAGVLWLVRRLARYGQGLSAGEVVLSGSFIRPIEAPPGCRIEADFGAFGAVAVDFGAGVDG
ncbi:MAG: 2-oxo-hepta-3-ene-1,7-dioic acid hydratase [Gemmobacter sp.]